MRRSPLALLVLLVCATPALALDMLHKSVSFSRQFIVYCDNANARAQIASFADETKKNVLGLLDQPDKWKLPVVITVKPAEAANPSDTPCNVQICATEEGAKIAIDVTLGDDPREIRFEHQLVRAVLLDLAYRDHPPDAGSSYAEPPAWLIEGAVEISHRRESGPDTEVFKTLLDSEHLPRLADFLAQNAASLEGSSLQLYDACAMSLVQLLVDLPDGRASLLDLLRHLQRNNDDHLGALIQRFPILGATTQSVEKWWTLSIARLAAANRYEGFSLQESEQRLAPLLTFDIPIDKSGATKKFTIDEFNEYRKLPASRSALTQVSANLLALGTQSSPLFRPVILDYQKISSDLAHGKLHRIGERLAAAAQYRELVLSRMDQIADYLNWFEATQLTTKSDSFDDYMKTAKSLANEKTDREDPITRYMDVVQQQTE